MAAVRLTVNGKAVTVEANPDAPLLHLLADDLKLNGPKFGCGLAQCGSCTVLLNGEPVRSCVTPVSEAANQDVLTLEGLGTPENPHPLQTAFVEEQAAQCGYCLSGIMLYGKSFIDKNPNATEAEVMRALNGLICRCHTHARMARALMRYAQEAKA